MCVYSMVADHYWDKWNQPPYKYPDPPPPPPVVPVPVPVPVWPMPQPIPRPLTQEEVDEMRDLLKKAKKYDEETGQKDCELLEKKEKIRKFAEAQGLKVEFP